MTAWVVRAGSAGESETWNLATSHASIAWSNIGDLSACHSSVDVARLVEAEYPDASNRSRGLTTGMLWAFSHSIAPGDIVVTPLKTQQGNLAVGRCTGPYRHEPTFDAEHRHVIPVQWRPDPVPRVAIKDDLLASLNAVLTVFSPTRNGAAGRLEHVLVNGSDSGRFGGGISLPGQTETAEIQSGQTTVLDPDPTPTLEAIRDRVRTHIAEHFAGHKLSALVSEILETMGFQCEVSPAGPDGGVDILAGSGPLGLDSPTVIVEVKSEPTPVGSHVLRGLHSAMTQHNADQGLLVALGGITQPARREFSTQRTRLRVWDADTLLDHLFDRYEQLPAPTRQRLPLTRAWVLDVTQL